MPPPTLALDVYGTLIDTQGVLQLLEKMRPRQAETFSEVWRSKQLEYSFRRALMRKYVPFGQVTREALRYTNQVLKTELSPAEEAALLEQYRKLPAFPEVPEALKSLGKLGYPLFAFSNGSYDDLNALLAAADILALLENIISLEEVQTFKPKPKGYALFNRATGSAKSQSWLISGNPFDVIGAKSYGMNAVWLKRNPSAVFDPLGILPDLVISDLSELSNAIASFKP